MTPSGTTCGTTATGCTRCFHRRRSRPCGGEAFARQPPARLSRRIPTTYLPSPRILVGRGSFAAGWTATTSRFIPGRGVRFGSSGVQHAHGSDPSRRFQTGGNRGSLFGGGESFIKAAMKTDLGIRLERRDTPAPGEERACGMSFLRRSPCSVQNPFQQPVRPGSVFYALWLLPFLCPRRRSPRCRAALRARRILPSRRPGGIG